MIDYYLTPTSVTTDLVSPVYLTTDTDTILVSPATSYGSEILVSPGGDLILSPTATAVLTSSILTPTIITPTIYSDPLHDEYIHSVNFSYSRPSFGVYKNLNVDPTVHEKISKYYYYKVLDKYLDDDLKHILNYFVIQNDKVVRIKSLNDYKEMTADKDSSETREKKIKYIEDNVLSVRIIKRILKKYVKETGTNWYDLPKQGYYVKDFIGKHIKKMIVEEIKSV